MNQRNSSYTTGVYDVPPSPSRVVFPSEVRENGAGFYNSGGSGTPTSFYSSEPQLYNHTSSGDVAFPSGYREHRAEPSASPQQQFNSPAHNFTQHLRERSPTSSSALLNLLQRYPSARQSVYQGGGRVFQTEERQVDRQVFRPAHVASGYPLVEVAVPKQIPETHRFVAEEPPRFGYGNSLPRDYPSSYKNYTESARHQRVAPQNHWPLDHDSFFSSAEDEMNRSTAEWKSSFAQMQERFRRAPEADFHHDFASTGSLPRTANLLSKSTSHGEIDRSLLGYAVNRAQEAPERSGAIDNFWPNTVNSRPSSPTVQRISGQLTAAERLQLLHEPLDSKGQAPAVPQRMGSRSVLAARREQYLNEAQSPPWTRTAPSQPLSPRSAPNFSDLDSAVQELQNGVRATGYSHSARRLGGCARFPTDETSLSPPPRMVSRKLTPSPDTVSESSSVYQVPTGLPHPKPKHNIKEQIYQAGVQNNYFPRIGLRTTPNFPVPSTGSVASRITEFEKRPGTPTLHIANFQKTFDSGPMSPHSTVFRAKPTTIHVDIGSSHHRPSQAANTVFNFNGTDNRSFIENASVAKLRLDDLATESPVSKRDSTIDASPRHNGIRKLEFDSTSSTSDSSGSMDLSRPARGITANLSLRGIQDDLMNEVSPFAVLNDDRYVPSPKPLPPVIRKAVPPPPKWYFPQGKPVSMTENDAALRRVGDAIRSLPGQTCSFENMDKVCKAAGLPLYWKKAIFNCMAKDEGKPITLVDFTIYWKAMTSVAHDEASRFVYTLTGGSGSHLRPEHFVPIVMDVIHTHPGLAFYRTSVEFHDQYCNVVITRIFWNHCRAWAPHLTVDNIRKGDLLEKIVDLEMEEDINKNLRYFSYEHFYVIYCLFWEIDQDHDLKISRADLEKHEKGAIPRMVVNRIFSQSVCRRPTEGPISQVGIKEFTQFLLADEDKTHPSSVDYWFRILDGDGKGVISLYDMESFYDGIQNKLMDEGIDCMKFNDVACNLIDAIRPKQETVFRLADLKNNKMAPRFFNSFVNWRKFYVQETTEGSDPVRLEDDNGAEITDWDRFCAEEYESLMEADADQVDAYDVNLDDEDEEHLTNGGAVSYNQLL